MLKLLESRVFWGIVLITGGVLFLLQNLIGFQFSGLFWAAIMGLAGLFFISVYVGNRQMWWALIPGCTLLSITTIILLGMFAQGFADTWSGSIFLGGIALSFVLIYLSDRNHWWAIIPGGVLLTLATVAGLENLLGGMEMGGIFFLGLGLTFAVVAILPTQHGQMKWAWIPAGVLLGMGFLLTVVAGRFINYLGPVALIVAGGYLIVKTLLPRGK